MAATSKQPDREELELRAFKAAQIVEALDGLRETEGWKTLVEIFEAAEKTYYSTVTRQLMNGREIEQRKLDYNRGIFDGVKQLLKQPDKAEAALANALERLGAIEPANKE